MTTEERNQLKTEIFQYFYESLKSGEFNIDSESLLSTIWYAISEDLTSIGIEVIETDNCGFKLLDYNQEKNNLLGANLAIELANEIIKGYIHE